MGRLFASEAPSGFVTPRAIVTQKGTKTEGPSRIRLASAAPQQLTFGGRSRARAPLLLCPMLLLLAALPWLSPEPLTLLRWLTSAACLGFAGLLARACWPRRQLVCLDRPEPNGSAPSPGPLRWVLDAEPEPDAPHGAYSVRVELDGGESWTVLRHPDPNLVLRELRAVLEQWPAPVSCRWRLPETAQPWCFEPRASAPASERDPTPKTLLRAHLCDRGLRRTLSVMTLLMLGELTFLIVSQSATVPRVQPLSVLLPIVTAACLLAITLILATAHVRLSMTGGALRQASVFGLRQRRAEVRVASVRGVYAIGASSAERWHVLIDSEDGPLSVPVDRAQAEGAARQARRAIFETRLSHE